MLFALALPSDHELHRAENLVSRLEDEPDRVQRRCRFHFHPEDRAHKVPDKLRGECGYRDIFHRRTECYPPLIVPRSGYDIHHTDGRNGYTLLVIIHY